MVLTSGIVTWLLRLLVVFRQCVVLRQAEVTSTVSLLALADVHGVSPAAEVDWVQIAAAHLLPLFPFPLAAPAPNANLRFT